MAIPIFIGDEVTAAGYRLAGAEVRVAAPDEAGQAFRQACTTGTPLVLITAEYARRIDDRTLHEALVATRPLVLVVSDAGGRVPVPDLVQEIRAQIGVEL